MHEPLLPTPHVRLKQQFTCPGHERPIDRAAHLARLAEFYPACLTCGDRHDTQGLSVISQRQRVDIERRATPPAIWSSEGLEASSTGALDSKLVAEVSTALAALVWQQGNAKQATVLVGCDGQPNTAELLSMACHSLALAGCQAIEVGAVTTPALAAACAERSAAMLWIGNASGRPHQVALRLGGSGGRAWSSPGTLDELSAKMTNGPTRARRGGGSFGRLSIQNDYLSKLAGTFHGLRPLVLVLDTTSRPFVDSWIWLSRDSACRALAVGDDLAPDTSAAKPRTEDFVGGRLRAIGRRVILDGAHFGIWVDGAGEACHFVDERGEPIPPLRILHLLTQWLCDEPPPRIAIAERANREQLWHLAQTAATGIAADGAGRCQFATGNLPDAMATVCLMLTVLSQSDRPLSEVLDHAQATE